MKEYRVTLSIVLDATNLEDAKSGFWEIISDDANSDYLNKELQVVELYTP